MPQTDIGLLLFIGAIFFLIGLLGGGFEISAIKIPAIGKLARILSAGMGVILMVIAISRLIFPSLSLQSTVPPTLEEAPTLLPTLIAAAPTVTPIPVTHTSVPLTDTPIPPTTTRLPPINTPIPSYLKSDIRLQIGQELRSPNGRFSLKIQEDGNLVLYDNGRSLWATNTTGSNATHLEMQGDGNLVLYTENGAVWASQTASDKVTKNYTLQLQDDGNLVIYQDRTPIWATETNQ